MKPCYFMKMSRVDTQAHKLISTLVLQHSNPLTKFEGGLQALHGADEAAAEWLSKR